MAEFRAKSLRTPDDSVSMPGIQVDLVDIGDLTVGRTVHQPGWRWSTHARPVVGGEWCQSRHVGVVVSGRCGVRLADGTALEFGPDDVYEIPPGHDGYTIGHEPCVVLEWTGLRSFTGFRAGAQSRVLATLLYTDLADAVALATRLGDAAWRERLSGHLEAVRAELERHQGHEVKTVGGAVLATFDAPAHALRCAEAIQRAAGAAGLQARAGVQVGEVELVAGDVRGVAVHEAERLMERAGAGDILVSETTRALAREPASAFEDRGGPTDDETGTLRAYAYRSAPTPEAG